MAVGVQVCVSMRVSAIYRWGNYEKMNGKKRCAEFSGDVILRQQKKH